MSVLSANHCGPYDAAGALQCVGHSGIIASWGEVPTEGWAATAAPYVRDFQRVPCPGIEGEDG